MHVTSRMHVRAACFPSLQYTVVAGTCRAQHILRAFDEFYETVAGLPYSMWALLETALGGWTGWYSWLDCWVHKKTGAHLSKYPGVRFAFTSDPPSGRPQAEARGARDFSEPFSLF